MKEMSVAAGRPKRLHEIDLLRFVAALMVLLFHFSFSRGQSGVDYAPMLGPVTQYGYLGVDLFFTISGMVVFMSLPGRSTRQFLISRVSRLYPAYWVAVTLTTFTVVVTGASGRGRVGLGEYLANLTMFPQLANVSYVEGVYWTLWSEWRFYALLIGFAVVGITAARTHWFMWGWLAAGAALEILPIPGSAANAMALVVQPLYCHYFIAGMALYLIYRSGLTWKLAVLLLASCVNAVFQGIRHAHEIAPIDDRLNPWVVAAVIVAIFAVMTLVATGALNRLRHPKFVTLGLVTYPLYLLHPTIGFALINAGRSVVNRWCLLVGVVAVLCALSWLVSVQVEARLQPAMRNALTKLWRTPAPARRGQHAASRATVSQRRAARLVSEGDRKGVTGDALRPLPTRR